MKKTLFLRRLVLLPAVAMALYAQAQITPVSLRIEHRPGDVLVDASLAKNTALQNESTYQSTLLRVRVIVLVTYPPRAYLSLR